MTCANYLKLPPYSTKVFVVFAKFRGFDVHCVQPLWWNPFLGNNVQEASLCYQWRPGIIWSVINVRLINQHRYCLVPILLSIICFSTKGRLVTMRSVATFDRSHQICCCYGIIMMLGMYILIILVLLCPTNFPFISGRYTFLCFNNISFSLRWFWLSSTTFGVW